MPRRDDRCGIVRIHIIEPIHEGERLVLWRATCDLHEWVHYVSFPDWDRAAILLMLHQWRGLPLSEKRLFNQFPYRTDERMPKDAIMIVTEGPE